ncbi:hypothetical protein TNCV_1758831 [Trichonephila clavipes]|nr:hypothetical protein TNCV_1758831 [Trichonephila clavipes]
MTTPVLTMQTLQTNVFNRMISPVWIGQHTHRTPIIGDQAYPLSCDMLGRRIAARQTHPTCLPELRRTLLDECFNIPQN